ncbi:MAG: xylulokinase [Candidatus Hydrogenedentota bacterium]|nr:MAG: xylulokinase [Candidatus Hydrogenedentota bacterium]
MYLGIDLGTSAVKAVLVDDAGDLIGQADAPLEVSRPHPLWSEQDPADWWDAVNTAVNVLKEYHPVELNAVRGIGLSGQMHGATLLDSSNHPVRPAILWNDGRSGDACAELEITVPNSRAITGNVAMPGFTAPKLVWLRKHEPETFAKVTKVLLPKDYLRLRMTNEFASDMSDSAGTLWLDVANRRWSESMLEATGLNISHMPKLYEGVEPTGNLSPDVAARWGMHEVPVAAGGGDNAAGAVGAGVIRPGEAFLSLGTSGVYFVAGETYRSNPEGGVHAFCHCLPDTWHEMSVILSAASCLSWLTGLTGAANEGALLLEAEKNFDGCGPEGLVFLPYLSGERTPHNNPHAKGAFFGMTHETARDSLCQAVIEGVAFAFADGQQALEDAGSVINDVSVIGGGSRSIYWGRVLAAVLGRPLTFREEAAVGPAFGAARLARLCVTNESPETVCTAPPVQDSIEPDDELAERLQPKLEMYRALYADTRHLLT